MKLVFDIGNSRVKWAYSDEGELQDAGAADHHEQGWQKGLPNTKPSAIWSACVAGDKVFAQLQDWAEQQWRMPVTRVHSAAQTCGVQNAYPRPERLGVDRWMACVAGHFHERAGNEKTRGSVLIADAGTAVTLDLVNADGMHKGGLISPGVATMRQALRGGTRLRPELCEFEFRWLADDTDPAVGLGTLHAVLALLENARRDLKPAHCLLTGGEAELLKPHLPACWQHVPHLVLQGVARVAAGTANQR